LAKTPGVKYVEANTIMRALETMPNDARFAELYGMHNTGGTGGTADADIDAPEAWDVSTGSRDIVVGIIDTGVDYSHPDIAPNYWQNPGETGLDDAGADKTTNGIDDDGNGYIDDFRGWDFVNNDNDPMDDNNHGTHCAGTIGGNGNDGVGVVGVNWQVSIVGIKFLSGSGSGSLEDAVKAIEYATSLKIDLTSNSWGGGGFSETMNAALTAAQEADVLFVAAAGNSSANNDTNPHYPSSYAHDIVLAVAATDHNDQLASFSCYGATSVDVAAPGVDILSSVPGNQYDSYSGTSMATPHVSGVAALVKSVYPDATSQQIKDRIMNTVDPVVNLTGKTISGGRVNAFNALETDTVAPGVAGNLQIVDTGLTSVKLAWAPAGDDGDVGQARRYDVRYSEEPLTEANWATAKAVTVVMDAEFDAPLVAGTIEGFAFNSTGYLAMKAVDNVGNVGELSESVAFETREVQVVARNDAESLDGAVFDAPWGLEAGAAGQAFSDSPAAQYVDDLNIALTLPAMTAPSSMVTLAFDTAYDLESGYDYGIVEITVDGGTTWRELERFTGTSAWGTKMYDLSAVLGTATTFQLRLKLTTDYSITRDGWKVDNIIVYAPAE
jgi:subtilisin family serine protease